MAHRFKKQFGQNFLRGTAHAQKVVNHLNLSTGEQIVEVGPGDGMLTKLLLSTGAKVTAIEIDYSLVPKLIAKYNHEENFRLINEDILEINIELIIPSETDYKITGSLPYNISKQIIAKFIRSDHKPQKMVFIVQDEVAKAYAANAPKATFLSNWLRLFAEVHKKESIPASQFFPRPKVDGGILEIIPHSDIESTVIDKSERILRIGFASPRKTLINNLGAGLQIEKDVINEYFEKLQIKPNARPAELRTEDWERLISEIQI